MHRADPSSMPVCFTLGASRITSVKRRCVIAEGRTARRTQCETCLTVQRVVESFVDL